MVVKFFNNSGITEFGIGALVTYFCSRAWISYEKGYQCLGFISSITGNTYYIPVGDLVSIESEDE